MTLTLTKQGLRRIENDQELCSLVAHADIIAVDRGDGAKPQALWMRPQSEVAARGLPLTVEVATFQLAYEGDVHHLQTIVDRMKHGD